MKNKLLSAFLLIGILSFAQAAEANSELCSEKKVTDNDRRDFVNGDVLKLDVDGDGRADTISARVYKTKAKKAGSAVRENHWIAFDLQISGGKTIKSIFEYRYGDNRADYWVYALVPCKISRRPGYDLLFYAGDDTSEETVILEKRADKFRVYSRKTNEF